MIKKIKAKITFNPSNKRIKSIIVNGRTFTAGIAQLVEWDEKIINTLKEKSWFRVAEVNDTAVPVNKIEVPEVPEVPEAPETQETPAVEETPEAPETQVNLDAMKKDELLAFAAEKNIEIPENAKVAQIKEIISEALNK